VVVVAGVDKKQADTGTEGTCDREVEGLRPRRQQQLQRSREREADREGVRSIHPVEERQGREEDRTQSRGTGAIHNTAVVADRADDNTWTKVIGDDTPKDHKVVAEDRDKVGVEHDEVRCRAVVGTDRMDREAAVLEVVGVVEH
jgi:hypothetical protein